MHGETITRDEDVTLETLTLPNGEQLLTFKVNGRWIGLLDSTQARELSGQLLTMADALDEVN